MCIRDRIKWEKNSLTQDEGTGECQCIPLLVDVRTTACKDTQNLSLIHISARTLAELLSGAIGRNYEDSVVFGREGLVGPRPANEIVMHSLRGGCLLYTSRSNCFPTKWVVEKQLQYTS